MLDATLLKISAEKKNIWQANLKISKNTYVEKFTYVQEYMNLRTITATALEI